ncbi:hypothetical protein B0H17DRAFT_1066016 [Mycena rosella]|uniref:CBM1 domain-containing protein n=1 Tax=Mycena rosella TaxID=1033263 RepID=A0AAD7GDS3_MYCRO|nr:hypothetical protein B0H17DRAFT_1066016 [Mycena rosella]
MGPRHGLLALSLNLALATVLPASVSAQGPNSLFSQCNGQNWPLSTTCVAGATCVFVSPDYSHCLPSTSGGADSSHTKSLPVTTTSLTTSTKSTHDSTSASSTSETQASSTTSEIVSLPTGSSNETESDDGRSASGSPKTKGIGPVGPAADIKSAPASLSGSSFTGAPTDAPNDSSSANSAFVTHPPGPSLPPNPFASPTAPAFASAVKSQNKTPIIVGVLVPVVLIILAAVGFILYKRRQRARDRREWEHTHAAIADAVRQVGSPGVTGAGVPYAAPSSWSHLHLMSSQSNVSQSYVGYAAPQAGGGAMDPFVDPQERSQPVEYPGHSEAGAVYSSFSPAPT